MKNFRLISYVFFRVKSTRNSSPGFHPKSIRNFTTLFWEVLHHAEIHPEMYEVLGAILNWSTWFLGLGFCVPSEGLMYLGLSHQTFLVTLSCCILSCAGASSSALLHSLLHCAIAIVHSSRFFCPMHCSRNVAIAQCAVRSVLHDVFCSVAVSCGTPSLYHMLECFALLSMSFFVFCILQCVLWAMLAH